MIGAEGEGAEKGMRKVKKNSNRYAAFYTVIILITSLILNCTPKIVYKETKPKPHPYENYNSEMVVKEIRRLEKLLKDTTYAETNYSDSTIFGDYINVDSTYTKEKILAYLFELYIHKSNPIPDYRKAYSYAEKLYKMDTRRKLYYLNWGRLMQTYFILIEEKDSLAQEIGEASKMSDKNKYLRNTIWKQSKLIDSLKVLIKEQDDTIQEQVETIKKLERLDIIMEKQRSKIE